jgi:hypothetical protein
MKKRKFQSGGLTQADRDAGLTEADIALGLRAGKQSSITDAERESAIARANRLDAESIVDKYRDFDKNPAAQAMPVDMSERRAPRAAPRAMPRRSSMAEEGPSSVPGTQMAETEPGATMSPRSGSRPRTLEDGQTLAGRIRALFGRPNPRRNPAREDIPGAKRGGAVNKMTKKTSSVSSASKRGDGIASRGKTKGRMV